MRRYREAGEQEKLAEAARLIPNCRLTTIEGAGHGVHRTRPEEYKEILQDFLFEQKA